MVAFGHTAVGAVIGLYTYQAISQINPIEGLVITGGLGIVSHYIADFIPHGHFFPEKDFKKKIVWAIIFDVFLSILIFSYAAFLEIGLNIKLLYILVGIAGSQFPDVLDGLIFTKKLPNRGILKLEHQLHQGVHWHGSGENGLLISILDLWQVAVVLISLFFIIHS